MRQRQQHHRGLAPKQRHKRVSVSPALAEPGFPIGDYMTSASDSLGRSVTLNVQVPPYVRRASSRTLAKGLFGFETEQDVLRYCLMRGLEVMADRTKDGEITGDVALLHALNQAAKIELEHAIYQRALAAQEQVVRGLVKAGHPLRAVEVAEHLWKDHDKLEDQYWRAVYRKRAKEILDYARAELMSVTRNRRSRS